MFEWLKNLFKERKETPSKRVTLTPKNIQYLNKAIEADRGLARGIAAAERVRREQAERKLKEKERVNVSELLTKQRRALVYSQYQNSFSWKDFFELLRRGKTYSVVSYDFETKFGDFYDLLTLKDGRLGLVVRNKGKIIPLVAGRTTKELFRNFRGILQGVDKGVLITNLASDGTYIEDVGEKIIPNVTLDAKGNVNLSKYNAEPFIRQLAEKELEINKLIAENQTADEILRKEQLSKRLTEAKLQVNESNFKALKTALQDSLKDSASVLSMFRQVDKTNATLLHEKAMLEEFNTQLENKRNNLFKKYAETFPKNITEATKEEMQKFIEWTIGFFKEGQEPEVKEKKKEEKPELPKQVSTPAGRPTRPV